MNRTRAAKKTTRTKSVQPKRIQTTTRSSNTSILSTSTPQMSTISPSRTPVRITSQSLATKTITADHSSNKAAVSTRKVHAFSHRMETPSSPMMMKRAFSTAAENPLNTTHVPPEGLNPTPPNKPLTRPYPTDVSTPPVQEANRAMHPRENAFRERVSHLTVTGKGRELEAYLASEPQAVTESGINNPDHLGSTLLCTAAKKHFFSTAIALLKFGADPNLASKTGPPLFHAISTMDLAITKLLLQHGANPDYQNSKGQTALMIAATLPSVAYALQLVENGCNKDLTDNDGRTALMYAARSGTPQMVEVLRDRGSNISLRDNSDKSAIEYCQDRADGRGEEIVSILRTPPRPKFSRQNFNYGRFQQQEADTNSEIKLEF